MKLIEQALLEFKQGRSDKVYEVDLCQIGSGYVVDFRYGRRGSNLREGSKTVAPVALAEAQRVFRALVQSKLDKGYQYQGAGSAAASGREAGEPENERISDVEEPARESTDESVLSVRDQNLLDALRTGPPHRRGARRRDDVDERAFDRKVWRVGERALREAEPLLLDIWRQTTRSEELRRYCLAWALGRCGGPDAIAHFEAFGADKDYKLEGAKVRRMAVEALRRLYRDHDNSAFEKFVEQEIGRLPAALAALARSGPSEAYGEALWSHLSSGGERAASDVLRTYLIDNEHVRAGLLHVLRQMPLRHPYYGQLRYVMKAAEFRRDGQVFGLVGYRFEKTRGSYDYWHHSRRRSHHGYHEQTRHYMRRRVWRTLRRLGQDSSPDFVKMAVGALLPFTDDDAAPVRTRSYYRWRQPDSVITWDGFASYWAFNNLLYQHSQRYVRDANARTFRCRDGYQPGSSPPDVREEAFSELWNQTPQGLLHLLDESRCQPVHEFAAKALLTRTDFLAELDARVAAMLLSRPYDVTARAGYQLAQTLYAAASGASADDERLALVAAVVECRLVDARRQGRTWFDSLRLRLGACTQLMATVATSAYPDNREYARLNLRTTLYSDSDARVIIGLLVAAIAGMDADEDERIGDIGRTLLECFSSHLADVGLAVIRDFMNHPAAAAQEFAAGLLRNHRELATKVPDDILFAFLESPHEPVRRLGAQLFGQLDLQAIVDRKELLIALCIHEHADLRESVRPVIQKLVGSPLSPLSPSGATRVAEYLVATLTEKLLHKHERGVHSHILTVLSKDLPAHLSSLPKERVWQLLHHKHPHAQELGGILLRDNIDADELTVAEIVKLASHEILSVREGSWALCERAQHRLRRTLPTAIRLLDARWPDSREWAMEFFRQHFTRAELTPDILVAICDSVRPDVQKFGRELITRNFEDSDGHTYMMQLSEHPATSLQLFASSYLERYASGDHERIGELESFFVSILSRVNRGRIAKKRAIAFLHEQALKSVAAAEVAARIFARQSATIAVGEREAMIKAMVDIARAHPQVELPITIKDAPLRSGSRPDAGDNATEVGSGV